MSPYEAANSWKPVTRSAPITTIARPATAESKSGHVLISATTKAYIKEHQRAESSFNTQQNLRYLMAPTEKYSAEIGLRAIERMDPGPRASIPQLMANQSTPESEIVGG